MYAVIFRAELAHPDHDYEATSKKLRELALEHYGCREFTSCSQGDTEIAISYWDSEEQIRAWKANPEHQLAQEQGRKSWYRSYSVQVAKVERAYRSGTGEAG